ncbi:endonuclease YncB(thermonuclease family) [Flavobacterium croceum DSM 17960]|uniref:Endonuclease YncB(Thermonuclease family) n=1 Tax=Flavobacterium croceum DSM 17960 TaxID=1121886 RepID=A0A2S4N5D2_9FLAO|nr:thermonuclease family protein [Flavobacterium croceum]POS00938.1 endonuclease YncB(thermonuclease family) [Flavobacterium croceum DSM 17960]
MIKIKFYLFLFLCSALSFAKPLNGYVVAINDGDTFVLLDDTKTQHKIRLAEIDCPESGQPFGKNAKQFLSDLIFNKTVYCQVLNIDKYGREICKVYLEPNLKTYVSSELVKAGLAWHYKRYSNSIELDKFEKEARRCKRGLWAEPNAIAPWNWRRN